MTASIVDAPSTFDRVVLAVSSSSQMAFLTSLPQLGGDADPTWVVGPGVATKGVVGTIESVDRQFGKTRSLLAAKAQARDLLESADPNVVIVAAGSLAMPFLLAARELGIGSIYFESPDAPSGRRSLVARLADKTVVEWEHQLTRHPFATVLGETL